MMIKTKKEHRPWNLSYKKSALSSNEEPSWSKHGMPALFDDFIKLVKMDSVNLLHLDLGCGNGTKTINFALNGLKTLGIDIFQQGLTEARRLIKKAGVKRDCRVMLASCLAIPLKKGSVSSASDILCFTHLKPADQKRYLKELNRILIKGADLLMVLFSTSDEHFHGHQVSKNYVFKYNPTNPLMAGYDHYHGMVNIHFDKQDIVKTFKDNFKIVKMLEVRHPVYAHRYLWNIILKRK